MGTILPFRKPPVNDEAVREQAAVWIARLDAGASESDLREIRAWLARDPAHGQVLLEFAELWDRMDILGQLSTMFPLDANGKLTRTRSYSGIAAAAAVLLLALGMGYWLQFLPDADAPARNFSTSLKTAVGEQHTVELADGSRIVLNTDSQIEINYRDEERHIELLRGEGLFEVASDKARPFRVQAGNRVVEAVGTAFSVHRGSSDELEVLVTEGRVLLHASTADTSVESLPLNAGQYVAVTSQQPAAIVDIPTDQLDARLSWQHGMLLFRDEPLAQVLAEIDRYTNLDIKADPAVSELRVAGYYRVDDIEGMLAAFDSNFEIDIQRNESEILLVPQ